MHATLNPNPLYPLSSCVTSQEMDKHLHNGQDFQYKVSWREAGGKSVHWNHSFIKSPPFHVNDTGTYTPFEIKVRAVNSLGVGPDPEPEIGHSGEESTSPEHFYWANLCLVCFRSMPGAALFQTGMLLC